MAVTKPINTGYNVIIGNGTGSNASKIEVWLEWKETSISNENNTSSVTVKLYAALKSGEASDTRLSSGGKSWITINNTEYAVLTNCSYDFRTPGQVNSFGTKTINGITHDADGSKSIVMGARFTTKSSYISGGTVSNRSVALTKIPRVSTIASITSPIPLDGSTTGSITLNRASSAYTHTITFSLGNKSKSITNVGTSTSFTLPADWVTQITSATSGRVNVSVQTYNGSTALGTPTTTTIIATVPSSIVPNISNVTTSNISDNTTVSGWGIYVQGYSKVSISVTASGSNGSSVSSYSYKIGNLVAISSTSSSYTSDIINQSGTVAIKVTAIDTRGRSTSTTVNITVNPYKAPSISSATAVRSSNGEESVDGGNILANMVYTFSSVAGHNSLTLKRIYYKLSTDSTYTIGQSSANSGVDYEFGNNHIYLSSTFHVLFKITDSLSNSAQIIRYIYPAIVPFNININGDGVGIGKYSDESETLSLGWKVRGGVETGTVTISSGWHVYNYTSTIAGTPVLRRFGNMVYLNGALQPDSTVTMGTDQVVAATIPVGFRPTEMLNILSQSSGSSFFLVRITPAGSIGFSRLRDVASNNSTWTNATSGMWFPFTAFWII